MSAFILSKLHMLMQEAARGSQQEAAAADVSTAEERSTALASQLASAKAEADQSQARCQSLEADMRGVTHFLSNEHTQTLQRSNHK